jgi:hypothetical protein
MYGSRRAKNRSHAAWRGIGNLLEFRPLIHGIITLVLAGMSLRTALGKAPVYPLDEVKRRK